MAATPDLSQSAARQRTTPETAKEPELIEASIAYIVYVKKDTGQFVLTHDINAPLQVDRAPTHDEVYASMHVIMKDIVGQQYAGMSAQAGLQLNTYMAGQLQAQQELDPILRNIKG